MQRHVFVAPVEKPNGSREVRVRAAKALQKSMGIGAHETGVSQSSLFPASDFQGPAGV